MAQTSGIIESCVTKPKKAWKVFRDAVAGNIAIPEAAFQRLVVALPFDLDTRAKRSNPTYACKWFASKSVKLSRVRRRTKTVPGQNLLVAERQQEDQPQEYPSLQGRPLNQGLPQHYPLVFSVIVEGLCFEVIFY